VARRRTTFGKLQRDREKQAKAQAKIQRRAEQAVRDPEAEEEPAPAPPEVDQAKVLASLAELHAAFDDGKISLDDFETRRDELRNSIRID
jgi:hypothetical protein